MSTSIPIVRQQKIRKCGKQLAWCQWWSHLGQLGEVQCTQAYMAAEHFWATKIYIQWNDWTMHKNPTISENFQLRWYNQTERLNMCITRIDNLIMNLNAWPTPSIWANTRACDTHTQREEKQREEDDEVVGKIGRASRYLSPLPLLHGPIWQKKEIKKTNTNQHSIVLVIHSQIITM